MKHAPHRLIVIPYGDTTLAGVYPHFALFTSYFQAHLVQGVRFVEVLLVEATRRVCFIIVH